MNEDEISTWLNSDRNDPGFQIMSDDEIVTMSAEKQVVKTLKMEMIQGSNMTHAW